MQISSRETSWKMQRRSREFTTSFHPCIPHLLLCIFENCYIAVSYQVNFTWNFFRNDFAVPEQMLSRCALYISKCCQGVHYLSANAMKVCTIYQQVLSRSVLFIKQMLPRCALFISKCYQGVHYLSTRSYLSISSIVDV